MFRNYDALPDEETERIAWRRQIAAGTPNGYDRQYAIERLRAGDNAKLGIVGIVLLILSTVSALIF